MIDLNGRVAVVTGGETGIGLAISRTLALAGAKTVIGGILDDKGQAAAEQIKKDGGDVVFIKTDVSAEEQVEALVQSAVDRFGKLDIMVNNAGVFDGFADCVETSPALWDRVIDINLRGVFLGTRAALKRMTPQRYGRIINTSSVGGMRGSADGCSYTASKFAIIGLTKQVACTHSQYGITVNAICPGVIQTDLRQTSAINLGDVAPDMSRGVGHDPDAYKAVVPAKRRGTTQEIADVTAFLASDAASYVTGTAIPIDGGWMAF
ncbi:SDR family NAD(P)-dependent oxidoreductase [Paraburkholderia caribensis]|uniref:Short-chain dehydrogenase/reductase SDR n=2 Tax=Paraburkholderia TaxID=1822464 RepID=B2JSD1_PARP8|nr:MULTISPECIES: SDR family NAD(P)-dependent oxidoreductase [Paraburkholderia]ACC73951.1 short-chain dehydrogenase/reductase SDR [Paraburkholderia phymatum STM815]MCO4878261.1 SDR family oxidoreductase [Paraburkholderia caribensis]PTB28710.1 SDR family NAD(P)-dependent oxidoreductase [Paraburkholderia caribensis]QLB66534.1 short-chain dehydrogenase [Paraburkholderia caribensis]